MWFLLSVLDGKHYCRGGNSLESENIDYLVGFMCKSEIRVFRFLRANLGPDFGGQRASQGLPWETPFSYFLGVQMLSVLDGKHYLRLGPFLEGACSTGIRTRFWRIFHTSFRTHMR